MPRHPTLQDLAKQLGVSRTTVSNAFNRPDQLSEELRERILSAARKLGYTGPNPVARMLRTGRAGAVGLLFSEPLTYAFDDPTTLAFLQGVGQVCARVQSSLLILPVVDNANAVQTIQQAAVDGFIIYCLPDDSPVVAQVLERRLPVVAVDQAIQGVPTVGIDDRQAARLAAEHLLALGHRRLGVLALDLQADDHFGPVAKERRMTPNYRVTAQRLKGYEEALGAAGIDLHSLPLWECPGNDSGRALEAARNLLDTHPRPTGLLAMSDRLALGVLEAARERGLEVPRDLSVVGFDDIALASQLTPTLTTIHQPLVEKGVVTAELLLEGTGEATSRQLEVQLVVRDSSGPPPTEG
ncbi:MAG: substrate-binding domain-containing protein [Candidatus Competibacteraceae bacterium]|nr:substrate-binding domain-containing protein [Candidatus Competibacteraceae bacterium]